MRPTIRRPGIDLSVKYIQIDAVCQSICCYMVCKVFVTCLLRITRILQERPPGRDQEVAPTEETQVNAQQACGN